MHSTINYNTKGSMRLLRWDPYDAAQKSFRTVDSSASRAFVDLHMVWVFVA